jgi:hypothetical protein
MQDTPVSLAPVVDVPAGQVPEIPSFPRIWGSAEYLLWRIKDSPVSLPLVTTGSSNDPVPEAGGQPHTAVLLGDLGMNYGDFSGGRITLGGWFDAAGILGFEASGFVLKERDADRSSAADAGGSPLLAIPFRTPGQMQSSILIAVPGTATGSVDLPASSSLWGAELNCLVGLYRTEHWSVDALVGYRYLELREDQDIDASQTVSGVNGYTIETTDEFDTRSQFQGGQLGARVGFRWDGLTVETTGKVALGTTQQIIKITGETNFDGSGTMAGLLPPASVGGVFANAGSSGHFARNDFTVVPECEIKVGYDVCRWLRGFVTYDFLYWNHVIAPGNQISGVLAGPATSGSLAAWRSMPMIALPPQGLQSSSFWAQGLSLGVELSW